MIIFESISIVLLLLALGYLLVLRSKDFPYLAPIIFVIFAMSASFASLSYQSGIDEIALLNVSNALSANFITTNLIITNTIITNDIIIGNQLRFGSVTMSNTTFTSGTSTQANGLWIMYITTNTAKQVITINIGASNPATNSVSVFNGIPAANDIMTFQIPFGFWVNVIYTNNIGINTIIEK